MPIPRKARTVLGVAGASVLGLVVLVAGVAIMWFGIDMLDEFEPQNIAYGSPVNPRIPDDEQRTDYILDTVVLIATGATLVLSVLAGGWAAVRPSPR